eukprot:TRINITY_DN24090_c0_g1_i1.p1 TRINITY_DN24090_c0_g1~~TRINITY_DN24090_c0_g1_i1.p1  ORF type:complete len:275 (+),score=27.73 TRINITY_DN24090_c0_g1_i1:52-876(+)
MDSDPHGSATANQSMYTDVTVFDMGYGQSVIDERLERLALEQLVKWCDSGVLLLRSMGTIYEIEARESPLEDQWATAAEACFRSIVKRKRVLVKLEEARLEHMRLSKKWVGDRRRKVSRENFRVDISNLPQDWPISRTLEAKHEFNAEGANLKKVCRTCAPTSPPVPHEATLYFGSPQDADRCVRGFNNLIYQGSPIRAREALNRSGRTVAPEPPLPLESPPPPPTSNHIFEQYIGGRAAQEAKHLYREAQSASGEAASQKSKPETDLPFEPLY